MGRIPKSEKSRWRPKLRPSKPPHSQLLCTSALESWSEKKAGRKEVDSFEAWCWRGALRTLWTSKKKDTWGLEQIKSETSLGAE